MTDRPVDDQAPLISVSSYTRTVGRAVRHVYLPGLRQNYDRRATARSTATLLPGLQQ